MNLHIYLTALSHCYDFLFTSLILHSCRSCNILSKQPNDFVPAQETMDSEKPPQSPGSRRSSGQEAVWIPEKQQVETMMKQGRCRLAKKSPTGDHYVKLLNTVEFFSRLLFPLVFIFLNIAYWIYFVGIVD